MSTNGSRLRPLAFGYRSCTYFEIKYHSFVGETECGRCEIFLNRHLLWGQHFWWLCDCAAIKEILEYEVNIIMVWCWDQELLGYHFSILHWSNKMMTDFEALTRRFGKLLYFIQYRQTMTTKSVWKVGFYQRQHCKNCCRYITAKSRANVSNN